MQEAKVIDNKLCCPICNKQLYQTKNYELVEYNGERYFLFVKRCIDCDKEGRSCRGEGYYLRDLEFESFVIADIEDVKVIRSGKDV